MIIFLYQLFIIKAQLLYEYKEKDPNFQLNLLESVNKEEDCLKLIQHNNFGTNLLFELLKRDYVNCTKQFILICNEQNIDLYPTFRKLKQNTKNQTYFNELTQLLPEHSPFLNIIEPCYLWAQNMTHLLMKIKFSSKIDIPGAQDINNLQINITLPSLYVNAYSFTHMNRYVLHIQTYKFMNQYHFSVTSVELGQIVLEILKSPSPYFWRNIHSDWFYNPPNQYIWWDMYYQYRSQLEVAFGLLEDTENMRESKEASDDEELMKTLKGRKRLKQMKENNHELQTQLYCRNCVPLNPDQWDSWVI